MAGLGKIDVELKFASKEPDLLQDSLIQRALDNVFMFSCIVTLFIIEGHWKLLTILFLTQFAINLAVKWFMKRKRG